MWTYIVLIIKDYYINILSQFVFQVNEDTVIWHKERAKCIDNVTYNHHKILIYIFADKYISGAHLENVLW